MKIADLIKELENSRDYFFRSTRVLEEEDSGFSPAEGTFTVAEQIAHTAQTIDWFINGAFGGSGWNMDFEQHEREVRSVRSLTEARRLLDQAFALLINTIKTLPEDALDELCPADDPILPNLPRRSAIFGVIDHTAHHRGALTIYARMLGKQPPLPYMEMP